MAFAGGQEKSSDYRAGRLSINDGRLRNCHSLRSSETATPQVVAELGNPMCTTLLSRLLSHKERGDLSRADCPYSCSAAMPPRLHLDKAFSFEDVFGPNTHSRPHFHHPVSSSFNPPLHAYGACHECCSAGADGPADLRGWRLAPVCSGV